MTRPDTTPPEPPFEPRPDWRETGRVRLRASWFGVAILEFEKTRDVLEHRRFQGSRWYNQTRWDRGHRLAIQFLNVNDARVPTQEAVDREPLTDSITRFLAFETIADPDAIIRGTDLYQAYCNWCRHAGETVKHLRVFLREASRLGSHTTINGCRAFAGLRLRERGEVAK